MQINITGKNISLSQTMQDYVEKKISKLSRFFDHISHIEVVLKEEDRKDVGKSHIVEVTLDVNGTIIKASEENQNFRACIDLVVDKLESQLKKYKEKLIERGRRGPSIREILATEEESKPKVVKVKKFGLKPMDIEEAILQMEMLGHDFFLYLDAETNKMSLLYKRKDGNYGLIIAEEE
ncbi:MAG: ribosome-associated translation inhibitor RaiA [Dictyoglomus sp.]|nr:ribosome-associated translation inhibitor RaiA [Dictyoglomus sp.]MCX7941735.1 ribosome-associated translation inhibitor RaiA [Dictyoglomaceae bacterium]MDW8189028.1 ribosome-associated translation inhibitor RaiA [Dictyoglomus sp.]